MDPISKRLHQIMIEQEINRILEYSSRMTNLVSDEFINELYLSILKLKYGNSLFGSKKRETVTILEIPKTLDNMLINSDKNLQNYQDILLDTTDGIKFIDDLNFILSFNKDKIATKDFRIIIDDNTGKVPEEAMRHIASVCACMCAGIIEYPIGYDHILEFMQKYGYTVFEYQSNGNLRLKVTRESQSKNLLSYQGGNKQPKSL